jgi:putative OPT family oligopeptide transporter
MSEQPQASGEKKFVPFVGEQTNMREFTFRAVILGLILTVILGAANAYLGLKAGMTIAATYPAAVLGMAILRMFKGSILEENIARTVGSIGESVAAGAIFTIPAFVIAKLAGWAEFNSLRNYLFSSAIMFLGGLLGIFFVTILRRVMVEDTELPFPESTAAAEIHKAGQTGGKGAMTLVTFMGVGALVQLLAKLSLFASSKQFVVALGTTTVDFFTGKWELIKKLTVGGTTVFSSPEVAPAYMGVGYIIGPKLASLNFAGGVLAWGLFVPLITYLIGPELKDVIAGEMSSAGGAASVSWSVMAVGVWKFIVRPIAVGGMLVGACYTLFKMRKSLGSGVKRAVGDVVKAAGSKASESRLDKDLNYGWVFSGILITVVLMVGLYNLFSGNLGGSVISAVVMAVAGFFFAAVSGYLVGTIGSSNNPISGLTLSTLIIAALLIVAVGVGGEAGVAAVLGVAAVVCVSSAVAGEMLQDLKVGHLLGGTPWKMQLGDILGVFFAAALLFWPLVILHQGDILQGGEGFGGKALPAPQAGLMAMLAKGIVQQSMAWPLVIVGMLMGLAMIMVQVKSPMLVAVGMYLPVETTFAIFVGGVIRWISDVVGKKRGLNEGQRGRVENTGILVAAGLIAGEALMGLAIAALAFGNILLPQIFSEPSWIVGLFVLGIVGWLMIQIPLENAGRPDEAAPPPVAM